MSKIKGMVTGVQESSLDFEIHYKNDEGARSMCRLLKGRQTTFPGSFFRALIGGPIEVVLGPKGPEDVRVGGEQVYTAAPA